MKTMREKKQGQMGRERERERERERDERDSGEES